MKKIALCFLISYDHILNQETLWKEWIEEIKDHINIYFHYANYSKITSLWIKQHCIPPSYVVKTSYYHVVPAYMNLLHYAYEHDKENIWFCFLTDSCIPIVTPQCFLSLFQKYNEFTLLKWSPAWWNVFFHSRANLKFLPKYLQLGHDPWFVLTREHVENCFLFLKTQTQMFQKICRGGLANESLFAIILIFMKKDNKIINASSTLTDWGRRSTATSPHLFIPKDEFQDTWVVQNLKRENPWGLFLRKVDKNYSVEKIKKWFVF